MPDYKILSSYKPPISSRVHSGEGQLIAEYALQKRLFIPYDSVPKKVIYSFLSAEDKNFYTHPGVDAKGVLRAVIKNISNVVSSISGDAVENCRPSFSRPCSVLGRISHWMSRL